MIKRFKPGIPGRNVLLLPLAGMVIFILLYIVAAILYPGGSWRSPESTGFSFWNNYLCDLLDHYAINGTLNEARYFARAALGFLCGSLLLLWYFIPHLFPRTSLNQSIMWISGILALTTTFFLSAGTHDLTVRIAGLFGVIAFIASLIELLRIRYYRLFYIGLLSLVIFVINYYIYETGIFIGILPVLQKFTFVCCIIWFFLLNISLIRKIKLQLKDSESIRLK